MKKKTIFYCTLYTILLIVFLHSASFVTKPFQNVKSNNISESGFPLMPENVIHQKGDSIIETGFSPKPAPVDEMMPLSDNVTAVTVTGYDEIDYQYAGSIQFDKQSAVSAGIHPFKLYYARWYKVKKKVYISSGYEVFTPLASKWCGLMGEENMSVGEFFPGYMYEIKQMPFAGWEITLTTWIYEVTTTKYNNGAVPADTWAPCKKRIFSGYMVVDKY